MCVRVSVCTLECSILCVVCIHAGVCAYMRHFLPANVCFLCMCDRHSVNVCVCVYAHKEVTNMLCLSVLLLNSFLQARAL